MARLERFELPTYGFVVRCSIQLSYKRISMILEHPRKSKIQLSHNVVKQKYVAKTGLNDESPDFFQQSMVKDGIP